MKYRVRLERETREQTTVVIECDDPDKVEDLAIDLAEHDTGNLTWEPVDADEPYAVKCEEAE